jgi:hypothetical protein
MLKVVVFASWQANRDYIAQNYCENKDNPYSHCAGSCHLAKQIEKTDETKAPFLPTKGIEKVEFAAFDIVGKWDIEQPALTTINHYGSGDEFLIKDNFTISVFHPPEAKV